MSADGLTERVQVAEVTSNFFDVLGVGLTLGRGFSPVEEVTENADVVVIGQRFWQRRWGGDPGVIGKSVELNGRPSHCRWNHSPRIRGTVSGAARGRLCSRTNG